MAQAAVDSNQAMSLVQKMYDCFSKADMEGIKNEVFAADIVWHLPGHHPLAGTKNGVDEVLAFFGNLNKAGIQVDLVGLDTFGDDGVIEVHRGHGEYNGGKLDALNCTLYKVKDDRISEVQVFIGEQHHVDLFFTNGFPMKPIQERIA